MVHSPDDNAVEEDAYIPYDAAQQEEYVPPAGVTDGGGDGFQDEYLPPQTDNTDYQPGYDANATGGYEEQKVEEVPVESTETPAALEVQIPSSATVPDGMELESPSVAEKQL